MEINEEYEYPRGGVYKKHAAKPSQKLVTVNGPPPLTITRAKALPPESITIYGNTVDGAGVGDKTTNLFYPSQGTATKYGVTVTVSGNIITLNGKLGGIYPWFKISNTIDSRTGGTPDSHSSWWGETLGLPYGMYTVKKHHISGSVTDPEGIGLPYTRPSVRIGYDGSQIIYAEDADSDIGATFTGTPNFIGIYLGTGNAGIAYDNYTFSIMLNSGSECIDYDPYGYKIPITCSSPAGHKYTHSCIYIPTQLYNSDHYKATGDELPKLFKGKNIISVDTAVQPSELTVCYAA